MTSICVRRGGRNGPGGCARSGVGEPNSCGSGPAMTKTKRPASSGVTRDPGLATGFGEDADTADVAGSFGDADDAAGVEQVEQGAGLDALAVGGQRRVAAH